ncbi:hypothetical protein [Janibacter sp. G1551]|uniref:hypothetical protein n=1 Tax=Janibacter sp. G1551 TaxID=3420440 RepID=UPI003D001378
MAHPQQDSELTDEPLTEEIELVGALLAAAAGSAGPLSADEIDSALGVTPGKPPTTTAGNPVHSAA